MTALLWIVLGPPAALVITFVAGRLLGARRGWLPLLIAGVIGFTVGTLAAGELTGWAWDSIDMALAAIALSTLFTMAVAVMIDLVAPVGSPCTWNANAKTIPMRRTMDNPRCVVCFIGLPFLYVLVVS